MRRRTYLRQGAVLAALGLAGCTGGPDGQSPTATPTTVPTDTPASTPTATATDSPTSGGTTAGTPTDTATASPTATPTPGGDAPDQEVTVGPGGSLRFDPANFQVAVGATVRWTWDSSGHNVRPSATPDDADWTGTAGGDGTTYSAGHTYSDPFEVAGSYQFYCAPHRSAGMTGAFSVG